MAIALQRFCLNRKIAPSLSIEAFFRLVNSLGLNKVELRNDLPTGKVTDDLSHQQVRELADRYHIEILTINAVYPFNRRTEQVRGFGRIFVARGQSHWRQIAGPVSAQRWQRGAGQRNPECAARSVAAVFVLRRAGLVEPLGFPQSSLRSAAQAQTLIRDAKVPFKLLIDTFHHHLYPQADAEFSRGYR